MPASDEEMAASDAEMPVSDKEMADFDPPPNNQDHNENGGGDEDPYGEQLGDPGPSDRVYCAYRVFAQDDVPLDAEQAEFSDEQGMDE
jgi:hypothetical protein